MTAGPTTGSDTLDRVPAAGTPGAVRRPGGHPNVRPAHGPSRQDRRPRYPERVSLRSLPALLRNEPAMTRVIGASNATLAVATPAQAFVLAGLVRLGSRRPVLVVTPTGAAADQLAHDLEAFTGPGGGRDGAVRAGGGGLPGLGDPALRAGQPRRRPPWVVGCGCCGSWRSLAVGGTVPRQPEATAPDIVVAPIKAVLQRLGPWRTAARPVVVAKGDRVDVDELVAQLVAMGYRRESIVEHRGELAVRGGIVDVFPSTADEPVRIDLWGDEVDRLTRFDVADQRSIDDLDSGRAVRLPRAGDRRGHAEAGGRPGGLRAVGPPPVGPPGRRRPVRRHGVVAALADRVRGADLPTCWARTPWWCWSSPAGCGTGPASCSTRRRPWPTPWPPPGVWRPGDDAPRLHVPFDRLLTGTAPAWSRWCRRPRAPTSRWWRAGAGSPSWATGPGWPPRSPPWSGRATRWSCARPTPGGAERLSGILAEEGLVVPVVPRRAPARGAATADAALDLAAPGARIVVAAVDRGFVLPGAKVAVLAESDVTGRRRPHRQARTRARPVDGFFDDLAPGSYVVHRQHGVAPYGGMVTRTMGGATRDYLLLEYRGGDKLYLPTDQIELLTPYAGGDSPTVSRLGGSEWQRARSKARAAVHEIAEELVALYRRRLQVTGHAFGPDTPWQAELESSFPFIETADQLRAIEEVKADMERPQPMDRLVCGDVGFGKTEVAIRAAFKAVQDGYQAAVLVPTTLLASQHAQTFADRYAPFPGEGGDAQPVPHQRPGQRGAGRPGRRVGGRGGGHAPAAGRGRHLQEAGPAGGGRGAALRGQPQGVHQGHGRRGRRADPDGQPHPPHPRDGPHRHPRPVHGQHPAGGPPTHPHPRGRVRGGGGLRGHPPRAAPRGPGLLRPQPGPGHRGGGRAGRGRWPPRPGWRWPTARWTRASLEKVVLDFWEGAYDVLVCTTIIESGIDMPTVNTLVVDRADLLGLGQLHQLRGRVGRAGQRAYAYLFHPVDRVLSEQAYERLRTIGDHTELGSGFKIALRDLQIRGAGNLLGRDQSGHIAAVGYDLYVQMVSEAVSELKGEPRPQPVDLKLDLPDAAHLPADLRGGRGRPPRGLPPSGRGADRRARSRTSAPSGRTGSGRCRRRPRRCSTWPGCGSSASGSGSPTWP